MSILTRLTIGTVSKPQGVKGEIKVVPLTDDALRFNQLKSVYIGKDKYSVKSARVNGEQVFLYLEGVDDRNAAELLRGKALEIDREDAVKLSKDRYFVVDVIGCEIVSNDEKLGVLTAIDNYGSADIYSFKTAEGKKGAFPAIGDIILAIDVENKVIKVDSDRLREHILYED